MFIIFLVEVILSSIMHTGSVKPTEGNTRINSFHENEAETRSPDEASKFRPNFDQDLRRQPFVGGFPYISSLSYSRRRTTFLP